MIPMFVWVFWPIVAIIAGLIGCFIKNLTELPGTKIAILGMQGAGKTRLLRFLQQKEYAQHTDEDTSVDEYIEFIYKKQDGTEVKILKGMDIGGAERFIPKYYRCLEDTDRSIIFVFNLYLYHNDEKYKNATNARFDYINRYFKGKGICTLGSHIDHFDNVADAKKAVDKFKESIENKDYANLVLGNFSPVNMTDEKTLRALENQILK